MQVCGLVTFDLLRWEAVYSRIVCLLEPYILSILGMWMTPYCDMSIVCILGLCHNILSIVWEKAALVFVTSSCLGGKQVI